jgi:hypothetical protein
MFAHCIEPYVCFFSFYVGVCLFMVGSGSYDVDDSCDIVHMTLLSTELLSQQAMLAPGVRAQENAHAMMNIFV